MTTKKREFVKINCIPLEDIESLGVRITMYINLGHISSVTENEITMKNGKIYCEVSEEDIDKVMSYLSVLA